MSKLYFLFGILLLVVLGGCTSPLAPDGGGEDPPVAVNQAPYDIVGPSSPQQVFKPSGTNTDFSLVIDEVSGQKDPDGDSVSFHYMFVSQTEGSLTDIVASIDSTTGVFSVEHTSNMAGQFADFDFWTDDPSGLTSVKFRITFYYQSN